MKENLFYIEQIKSSLHAAIIGSCNCNVKSPEPLKNSLDSIK